MTASTCSASDALLRIVLARQRRVPFRLGMVAVIGLVSLVLTGLEPVLWWLAACVIHQLIEYLFHPRNAGKQGYSRWQSGLALGLIFSGNVIFNALGVLQIAMAGAWGMAFACLLWSGSWGQAVVGNVGSRKAVIAYVIPPIAYVLCVPFLVMNKGAPPLYGLALVYAALLQGLVTLEFWTKTEKRFEQDRKEQRARQDSETGLPNRLAFEEAIASRTGQERAKVDKPGRTSALVVAALRIDRFGHLQGAIGHSHAIRLIGNVIKRLGDVHHDVIARLSQSTLGVMFHAGSIAEARAYVGLLQSAMIAPIGVEGTDIDVSFTVGMALQTGDEPAGVLLERAAIALGQARMARNAIGVFEALCSSSEVGNLSQMSDMLRSIERGQIINHYQPKYDLRSGEVVAVEALVRWQHPERGAVAPDAFIPLAEETGRIRELTLHVLSLAIKDQAWLAARGFPLAVAVNLSGRLLDDSDFIETIIDLTRAAAGEISMEVTETAMMAHPERALALLARLRLAGIGVSIDDYGTGLSSLAYLKNIPADELKIDKSFVTHMDSNQQDCVLVRSTIALAHSFGLRVVAEGVESGRTLEILGQMNCDLAQGYHMARPMPIARLAELLERGARVQTVFAAG